jgi:hypothetical protein
LFQRDYFMRMIQQMTEAIGQIMQLRKEHKQEEGLLLLDELLEKHFHLSRKLISSLSDEDLVKVVSRNGMIDAEQLQAIALLLKQEALLQNDLGRERESYGSAVRSLRLFLRLSIMKAEPIAGEINGQIEELCSLLKPYELPLSAKRLLLEWHEAEGRYDQVENIMYELIEDSVMPAADAAVIYRRLLELDDMQLEAGGLPREEALQGLKELNVKEEETQAEHE